jgi:hypothetical protein
VKRQRDHSVRTSVSTLPTLMIDLAAARTPATARLDDDLLVIANDHRMTGLLWSWARPRQVDAGLKTALAIQDLADQAHLERVSRLLESCTERLSAAGIDVAAIKGVTAEARWYTRPGERPCVDVDLLLAPHHLDRAADVVELLQPQHPWAPHIAELAIGGRVQSIDMMVEGIEVDLHLDLLKLGVPTRQAADIWDRTVPYRLPSGRTVRVLDDTTALFHLLVHLNKDRFQRLLGFADIARIVIAGQVDWGRLERMARGEGIDVAVFRSLEVVLETLQLPWPDEVARHRGPRALVWTIVWRRSVRLRGTEGRLRFRQRQDLITLLARGRVREAAKWWFVSLWPPRRTVAARYAHIPGPYLWKLSLGRLQTARAQRRSVQQQRARAGGPGGTSPGPVGGPPT